MIYVGGLNNNSMQSWGELVGLSIATNVALTDSQRLLLITELQNPKYVGLNTSQKLVELSKSTTEPGQMPRQYVTPGEFMVIRSLASQIANSPGASVQQKAVWAQFGDPSLSMGSYDAVYLTRSSVRGGLDACLLVGLIGQNDYNTLLWVDANRTAGWAERTYGAGYVLMPSDLEALD